MSFTESALEWTREVHELKQRLAWACERRDDFIVAMHEHDGIPKSRVSDVLRSALALGRDGSDGLTEAQIEGLGVSEWSVRRVFDKAREKEDTTATR